MNSSEAHRRDIRHHGKEMKRKLLGLGLATIIILPFLLHPDNFLRTSQALTGSIVECVSGTQATNSAYLVDAIVVPSAGVDGDGNGDYNPSLLEQIRLRAAAIAYANHLAPNVILLDGAEAPNQNPYVTRTYLKSAYKSFHPIGIPTTIPTDHIFVEHASFNTATNMAALQLIVRQHNFHNVIIITNSFHRNRATLLACNYGVAAFSLSAEEIIQENMPDNHNYLTDSQYIDLINRQKIKESAETVWMYVDPLGLIPTAISKITNNRQ